jgi:hypothetical protein
MWIGMLLLACKSPEPEVPVRDQLEADRQQINQDLNKLIYELQAAGRYDCCIKSPCKLCALRGGGCKCGEGLRRGEPVCEECALMWLRGQGDEPNISPKDVRSFLEAEHQAAGSCMCDK